MTRTNRIALLAAVALILAVSGTVLAIRAPNGPSQPAHLTQDADDDTPPTADELAHAADRLRNAGVTVDDAVLSDLAASYGLGGAVRIMAWSNGDAAQIASIRAMRDGDGTEGSGMGWGRIAKELGKHPGIGSIMGGGNPNPGADAPGRDKKGDEDDASGG
jgi:hypothetical protein